MKTADIPDKGICIAVEDAWKDNLATNTPFELIIRMFSAPPKVAWSALERAYRRGLVESGVSLRCCWLTDKGKEMLGNT